ncbi:hypothetical protein OPQ81_001556 [Rhizoctonia solani]|nr:hypothetical protein OPQ81_001556 [Rhizoctonia solani]
MAYVLNQNGVPEDLFNWNEAFETWLQRRRVHVNWVFDSVNHSNQWSATVTVSGHTVTGIGSTRQHAKKNAVIQIEQAGILH